MSTHEGVPAAYPSRSMGRTLGAGPAAGKGSVLDADGLLRAAADGFLDRGTEVVGRPLLEDVELVLLVEVEHRRRRVHAQAVRLAEVEVDHDPHGQPTLAAGVKRTGRC